MMRLPPFEIHKPTQLADALKIASELGSDAKMIAGGTDLLPSMKQNLFTPKHVVSLQHIKELHGISQTDTTVTIGALTRLNEISESDIITQHVPALGQACALIASVIIQNMGTLGGNLMLDTRCYYYNQSAFWRKSLGYCLKKGGDTCHVAPKGNQCFAAYSSDTAPVCEVYDATLEIQSAAGSRTIEFNELFTGDGQYYHTLAEGELITQIHLKKNPEMKVVFLKHRYRQAIDYALVSGAFGVSMDAKGICTQAKICLTSIDTQPYFATEACKDLVGQKIDAPLIELVAKKISKGTTPLTTHGPAPGYRRRMVAVLTKKGLSNVSNPSAPTAN